MKYILEDNKEEQNSPKGQDMAHVINNLAKQNGMSDDPIQQKAQLHALSFQILNELQHAAEAVSKIDQLAKELAQMRASNL